MHPPHEISPALDALPRIHSGFFGRRGGVSEAEFASLNASRSVGDDQANVTENIHRAVMALKAGPLPVALAHQVHGVGVITVGDDHVPGSRPEADALVTTRPGIALGVLTADCVPVLLADSDAGVIGAAHAGWRGAVSGVLEETVKAMVKLGAKAGNIVAGIGPCISAENYEIGQEMAETLRRDYPDAVPFIKSAGFSAPHFDVPGLVISQAETLGLRAIDQTGGCTYAYPDRYFSHRHATHNQARAGRQIALIALG